jgi:hypothetical protein
MTIKKKRVRHLINENLAKFRYNFTIVVIENDHISHHEPT